MKGVRKEREKRVRERLKELDRERQLKDTEREGKKERERERKKEREKKCVGQESFVFLNDPLELETIFFLLFLSFFLTAKNFERLSLCLIHVFC
jgi:hypothetical protein